MMGVYKGVLSVLFFNMESSCASAQGRVFFGIQRTSGPYPKPSAECLSLCERKSGQQQVHLFPNDSANRTVHCYD